MFRLQAARLGRAVSVALGVMAAGTAGGCAQLVGIDSTELAGNSIQLVRTSIGTTVDQAPLDLDGLSATYLVAGASATGVERVTATAGIAGRWTSGLRAPAPVEVTLPDVPTPFPRLFDLPSQHLRLSFDVLEHPGRTAAPDGAMFGVTVPITAVPEMGDMFQAYVVGAWLMHALPPTSFTVVDNTQLVIQPFAFTASDSLPRRAQIDRVTNRDAFLILRYADAGARLTGVAEALPFDQTEATTSVMTRAMTPVVADQMLAVKVATSAVQGRLANLRPAVVMSPATSWSLTAAPGYALTSSTGPLLQAGVLAPTAADPTVSELTVAYGNPFAGRDWRAVLTVLTVGHRTFTLPGTMSSIALDAGFVALLEPPPAGTDLAVSPGMSAGIPVGITMNRAALSTDGQEVKQPTGFVEVSFSLDKLPEVPGAVHYAVQVHELVPGAADMLERHVVFAATSTEPQFSLPANVFQAGHNYLLRAISVLGGFTDADAGDLVSRSLPLTQGFLDSAVIQVVP